MKFSITFLSFLFLLSIQLQAQHHHHGHTHVHGREIQFPDVTGYKTLKCDLHIHTVFSDGSVWPNIRVEEAVKDGLDVIAMTDHLEYQPHKEDIPHPDRNRSYQVAKEAASGHDLIVLNGSEVTREMPPGHCNAIFVKDANKLLIDDPMAVFREAKNQNAFVFWNHPNWTAQAKDGIAQLTNMHKELLSEGLIQGIEVVNQFTYSAEALQIALDNDLTIMGTSDIHGLIDWDYEVPEGGHRPVTMVFAEERTESSIKEALQAGRTAVWHNNLLIGKEENVTPLIHASLQVQNAAYQGDSFVANVELLNNSDAQFLLRNKSEFSLHVNSDIISIEPNGTTTLEVKTLEKLGNFTLTFEVMNAVTAPKEHPDISFEVEVE